MAKRISSVLSVLVTLMMTSGVGAQASSGSGYSPRSEDLARDPSGRLVAAVSGTRTPWQHHATTPPPAAALPTGAGTGCAYRATSQYFCRAGAYQYVASDGAYMSTPVRSPSVASADYHSLAELAVESTDGRQIVEVGWRIYRPQDQTPRLFVFHWINGQATCYNGCGYRQSSSSSITPGMALTPSTTPVQFAIQYFQGNWWLGYNGAWFGYFPGSEWSGTFTRAGLVQIFGEVSSTTATPCTDMGNGLFGTNASAAAVTGVGYYNTTAATNLTRVTPDDATLYDSQVTSTTSFRYGGPGAC